MPQLIERAEAFARDGRRAIVDGEREISYRELLDASSRVARRLLTMVDREDLEEARVALWIPPSVEFVAILWGIWRAGGIAVPLCLSHPAPELEHVLHDADVSILVTPPVKPASKKGDVSNSSSDELDFPSLSVGPERLERLSAEDLLASSASPARSPLPEVGVDRRALLIYTSGTTGKPKGVVWHHGMIDVHIRAMTSAWGWSEDDHALGVLPLHHVHGLVNVQTTALWNGAVWQPMTFDAEAVWRTFEHGEVSVFMAVPTVYVRLLAAWEAADEDARRAWSMAASRLRLMVSGSAALPADLFERWRQITGHALLERYGMSEIGMALSNPLRGERVPGHVGWPMPDVEIRLVDEQGEDGRHGEIWVRGPGIFREYWRRPDATTDAFRDGWFVTGDVAEETEKGYRILGRRSVDILKSGGYKLSALEIESELRQHPCVEDCAVVGIADPEWGERVAIALTLRPGTTLSLEELRAWGRDRLAPYKLPSRLKVLDELPRNALGKVVKPRVRELFEATS